MRKVIIDTDIGDDIDDAFALYLAMRLKLNIIGVTTVFKNTLERSRMVKKILKLYSNGYERVPVYVGYGQTLENTVKTDNHIVQYSFDLQNPEYAPDSEEPGSAIEFLIESARKYGEELTILAIGPFTNIAKALQKDKKAFEHCKVVIMGGAYFRQYADWNVMCDVKAAEILFKDCPNLECLGADVTHCLNIGEENANKIRRYDGENAVVLYLKQLLTLWMEKNNTTPWLHDPLTVYYTVDPTICEMRDASIIVLTDGFAKGMTLNVGEYRKAKMNSAYDGFQCSKKVKVACTVNRERMIDLFMASILA